MSERDRLTAYSGVNPVEFYHRERPEYVAESRRAGLFSMIELRQPAGSYPDPDSDNYVMLVPLRCDSRIRFDFGAGRFEDTFIGHISLAPPGVICEYELASEHHFVALSFPAERVADLLSEIAPDFSGHFGPLHGALWRDRSVRDLALSIWRSGAAGARAPDLDADAALMRLSSLLFACATGAAGGRRAESRLSPHLRRRIAAFIEDHLEEDLSLFRLAAVAGLSPFHFARAFRHDLGDPPHRYVLRRRIARATRMIRETNAPLAEVAAACGFSSQSRLNDVFAREVGATPGALRRTVRA